MDIGYARVSTREQNVALQVDALKAAGCARVLTEVASGASTERPVLAHLLDDVRPGDVIVIWKLDRLGRSLRHLIDVVSVLLQHEVGLRSLNDPVDTTTAQGRLVFNLFASLAEFEREVIRERTQAGLSSARARGRKGGRPKGVPAKAEPTAYAAETLYREGQLSAEQIAQRLHISKSTLYAYLRHRGVPVGVGYFYPSRTIRKSSSNPFQAWLSEVRESEKLS
ncbi:DNA-invertase hin [Paraburkholderia phenoliruptrix]|jgi:DNA invertase Pin-like site-specific DNA recombinase|uniref:DNA-invertase hin n=1 Tax=Paraburkholderia phenoliruptrix TaxID=252970 RepID=A0A6J5C3K3_9BURK|nr:recombinase family protein [Paraburkholderia phenoliruptrix]CAB3724061.1 DNA-invertase hin [Paraburkholderia phenoliruptrix]